MLKIKNEVTGLDIELKLDDQDRSLLSAYVKQQGFDILQKLMEDQVRRFSLNLLNTYPADERKVLAAHYLAFSVAQFYQGLIERLNQELQIEVYNNRNKSIVEEDITAQSPEWK